MVREREEREGNAVKNGSNEKCCEHFKFSFCECEAFFPIFVASLLSGNQQLFYGGCPFFSLYPPL